MEQSKGIDDFFSEESQDTQQKAQKAFNKASKTGQQDRKPVVPGKYVMEVGTFAWIDKKSKELMSSPIITTSKNKSLQLCVSLQVCKDNGTEQVPDGSSIFHYITLLPAKGADQTKIDNTMRFMKPAILALTGKETIEITKEWLKEYCTADFVKEGNAYKVSRDHKMKEKVFVNVGDRMYNDKIMPVVKWINQFKPGDVSVTNSVEDESGIKLDESAAAGQVQNDLNVEQPTQPDNAQKEEDF